MKCKLVLYHPESFINKSMLVPSKQPISACGQRLRPTLSNFSGKSNRVTFKAGYRCFSAPPNRTSDKTRCKTNMVGNKSLLRLSPDCNSIAVKPRYKRCSSAPSIKACNEPRQHSASNEFSPSLYTVKQHASTQDSRALKSNKFSTALLMKNLEFDTESFSDVMSFSDDFIEHHLDMFSTSDNCSVVDKRHRPQSCIQFGRTPHWSNGSNFFPDSKYYCTKCTSKRPSSSPSPRQRVKAKQGQSNIRRGNVPRYVSFVAPMPVHLRPGTGKSSGYGSAGISVVSEDLLVSAGAEEEIADSGEETESEFGILDSRGLLGFGKRHGMRTEEDIDDASQEAIVSARSSALSQHWDSELDAEGSFLNDGNSDFPNDDEATSKEDIMNDEFQIGEADEGRKSSTEAEGANFNFEDMLNGETSDLTKFPEGDFSEYVDSGLINGENGGLNDGNDGTDLDNADIGDASSFTNLDDTTNDLANGLDSYVISDQDLTDKENVPDNNLQVTFSEPLTTELVSTNLDDNGDSANREQPKSILKGNGDGKSKIYELEVEPSIMKRMTSPVDERNKMPPKPVIGRREADLKPQSRSDIVISDYDKQAQARREKTNGGDEAEQETSEDEDFPDAEFSSSPGGSKLHRSKPKNNIYGKRANLKPPSQKLHKRKGSGGGDSDEDGAIISAESSLLMEQILEQERRLKEGMKPWLKGRLALSQQNSRFEIPMDVRLLETMTPMEYLANYCVISKRRKALYKHVFKKVDRNRDGNINFTELEKGLKDVHTGLLDSEHVGNIIEMVNINKEAEFDLKQFSAVAAFSERISCKYQLPVELLNNLDGQKEVIESADFFALSWKLDGIHVNPAVKKILDSL